VGFVLVIGCTVRGSPHPNSYGSRKAEVHFINLMESRRILTDTNYMLLCKFIYDIRFL